MDLLTKREQEVLMELAKGKMNKEIARSLVISPRTVRTHLRTIYLKLGITTRSEAIVWYFTEGKKDD